MLESFTALTAITKSLDSSLRENHPGFFGPNPRHPFTQLKGYKVIYHHPKVLSAEGLLVRLLRLRVEAWKGADESDDQIMRRFLTMTDTALDSEDFAGTDNSLIEDYRYRVQNRLLPRVVFNIGGTMSHAEGDLVRSFLTALQDKQKRSALIDRFEIAIGNEILEKKPDFAASPKEALYKAGVWLDVPKTPDFEDADAIIGKAPASVSIDRIFPIGHWTEAYKAHRYFVRVFAFSEFVSIVEPAAQNVIKAIIGVSSKECIDSARKNRINGTRAV